ncbi:MAG: hypothetical protein QM756_40885 [Polyangiaceae bacterium]
MPGGPAFGPSGTVAGFASPLAGMPPGGYGAPPAQPGYGAPPVQPGYGAPPGQPGYGAPPAQPGYGAPPAQPGYGAPPAQPGYGAPPAQPGYGAPPAQPGYGASPAQPGYGAPPQSPGQAGYGPAAGGPPAGYGSPQSPAGPPGGGYVSPGAAPPGAPAGAYGPPGGGGGGYGPPGGAPPGGYGPPGGAPPGGYGPPGGAPPGGYGPPGGAPPGGYGPPGGAPPGGYGPPGGGGYGPPGGAPPGGYGPPGGFGPPPPVGGYGPPGSPPGGVSGAGFTPMEAVLFGWNWVKKDFGGIALPLAVAAFVMFLPQGLLGGARGFAQGFLQASGALDANSAALIGLITTPISMAIGVVAQAYFWAGMLRFALSVARGRKPDFGDVFSGGPTFGAMLVGHLLLNLGVLVGAMLCIVPGVILALGCQFYALFVIDKQQSGVDALKSSWAFTQGHKMNLFILYLVMVGVSLVGLAACCVGLLLVAVPVQVLAQVYVYMKLNGELPVEAG